MAAFTGEIKNKGFNAGVSLATHLGMGLGPLPSPGRDEPGKSILDLESMSMSLQCIDRLLSICKTPLVNGASPRTAHCPLLVTTSSQRVSSSFSQPLEVGQISA